MMNEAPTPEQIAEIILKQSLLEAITIPQLEKILTGAKRGIYTPSEIASELMAIAAEIEG